MQKLSFSSPAFIGLVCYSQGRYSHPQPGVRHPESDPAEEPHLLIMRPSLQLQQWPHGETTTSV